MTDLPLDHKSTTVTTRKWVVADLVALQSLLAKHGDAALPDYLKDLQQTADAEGHWPQWFVLGIAVRIALRDVHQRVTPQSASLAPQSAPRWDENTKATPLDLDALEKRVAALDVEDELAAAEQRIAVKATKRKR